MARKHMNYTTLAILLAVLLAFLWPQAGMAIRPFASYLLIAIMLVSLLGVRLSEIVHIPKKTLFFAFIIHYIVIPLTGWVLIYLLVKNPSYATGMILGLVMPVGITAPALSKLMGGNFEESLAYTMLFSLLAIIVAPLMFWLMAGVYLKVDPVSLIKPIALFIIVPLILAKIVERFADVRKVHNYTPRIAIALLFLIIWGVTSPAVGQILSNLRTAIYFILLVFLIILVLMTVVAFISRLAYKKPDEVSLILLIWKNYMLAIVLASTVPALAQDKNIVFAVIIFALMMNIVMALFIKFLERFKGLVLG